jgi:8-oxo-dGTP pyrophosphatase MutT (NUDIX family)
MLRSSKHRVGFFDELKHATTNTLVLLASFVCASYLSTMADSPPAVAHPAATVVLLRQGSNGCEVLLVRRNRRLDFHGGAWVFPGGRLDPVDYLPEAAEDIVAAARRAAVREAREEAGVSIEAERLALFARWITPDFMPKRFDTWFFAATGPNQDIRVDGGEIHEHAWIQPADALAAQARGEIELPPPTFVTILELSEHRDAASALASFANGGLKNFVPRICRVPGGACSLYEGDAGYEAGNAELAGPRHRLWMMGSEWIYEKS